jgi:hypothetical protein
MQLLNGESRSGSVVLELTVSLALIVGIGVGAYGVQHPHLTQAQQIAAAMQR